MQALLKLSRGIDALNTFIGKYSIWLIFAATFVSAANAIVRKAFDTSSNAFLEVQWYFFAWSFLLAAGYTLLCREHVRIDVINSRLSRTKRVWIEILGFALFLTPLCLTILYLTTPIAVQMYQSGEVSSNPGGLIRWPVWAAIPVGVTLLLLQGWSELIKAVAYLKGDSAADPLGKLSDKSAEEDLAEALRLEAEKKQAEAAAQMAAATR